MKILPLPASLYVGEFFWLLNQSYMAVCINKLRLKGQDYMTNKTYIRNTVVLFAAMAVTKIVGAVFKIPLANILGGTGMGYFSTAYGLYSPVFAVTAAGIPTVLMRQTAQNMAAGHCRNAIKTKHTALLLFTFIGIIGMLAIWLLSPLFADKIACSPQSHAAIVLIAPAVLFCCIASVYRGYYEGCFNVIPTAVANVTEAVSRAVIGLAAAYGVLIYSKYCFSNGLDFLGEHYNSYADMYNAALPIAAAGAVFAVTVSEFCGLAALLINEKKITCKDGYNCVAECDDTTDRMRDIAIRLLRDILPIAVFALVMNCFSFIDLLTVTRTLNESVNNNPEYFFRTFPQIFSSGISRDEFANFAYGSYTGIATSLFMLIPSFAGMTEKTSIPEISTAWEKQDIKQLSDKTEMLFKAAALIGCPACFGAAAMSEPILTMLYAGRTAEIAVCVDSFTILCGGGIFMIVASAVSGFFQAVGKATVPLWLMAGAVAIKSILNPLIISQPQYNISGAAAATVVSYCAVAVVGFLLISGYIKIKQVITKIILIALDGAACAFAARVTFAMLSEWLIQPFPTVLAILTGGFVYVILLIITGVFRTSPIIKSEKQKKIRKGLEKSPKIG